MKHAVANWLTAAALLCLPALAVATDDSPAPAAAGAAAQTPPADFDLEAAMAAYAAVMNPGPEHQLLERFTGDWQVTSKMYWDGPEGPAMETVGRAQVRMMLGGRFVHEHYDSEMMMPGPDGGMTAQPFHGIGFTGYDRFRRMYRSVWMDNMGTQMLVSDGVATPDGQRLTFYGQMDEPMLGVVGRPIRYVIEFLDGDSHRFTMYDLHAGEDYKVMEMTYERVSDDADADAVES